MLAEILQLAHGISSLLEMLQKKGLWKADKNLEVHTRSSHSEVFCQKRVFWNFAKFAGKHLSWCLFFIKLMARAGTLLERDSSTVFSAFCEFSKISRRTFWRTALGNPWCFLLFVSFSQINEGFFSVSLWVFFHEHSRFTEQNGISVTPLYHFHSLHRHLHISRVITAEWSSFHIAAEL